jgi:hypothetical protein
MVPMLVSVWPNEEEELDGALPPEIKDVAL